LLDIEQRVMRVRERTIAVKHAVGIGGDRWGFSAILYKLSFLL
jgi:hypothetical protein